MIGYISGKLIYTGENNVILETGGVGYELTVSANAMARLIREGGGGVFTYLNLTQDAVTLYGFDSMAEKSMFLHLISVSHIGPKVAISILTGISLRDLAVAIATSDVKRLAGVKGCGKKMAERIIVELREKMGGVEKDLPGGVAVTSQDDDAAIALMGLGFSRAEADLGIRSAKESGAEKLEDVIAVALKNLAKK